MPVLNAIPLETTLPAHTRRRLWTHPEVTSHSALVLTFDRLYLAPLAGAPRPELAVAIEAGAELDVVLGPLAVVLDLVTVRDLSLDLLTNSLTVEYASSMGTSRVRVTFATPEAADGCFTKLWRRLGEEFELAPYQRDNWSLIRAPLAWLAVILFFTAALAGLLSVREDHGVASSPAGERMRVLPGETLLNALNWKVVCGVGGMAAALSQVWLYRRVTTPPVALELIRK